MNKLAIKNNVDGFVMPEGAEIVEDKSYYTSTYRPNDTLTERLVFLINGRNVQIIRYNKDNNDIMVFIGTRGRQMRMVDVGEYIRRNT
jgi:hypothetical protein